MSKIPFEKRPICSCGCKMKMVEYKGYYEEFKYWECENCDIEKQMWDYEADKTFNGSYR